MGDVPDSSYTGVSTSVQYAVGAISGPIKTAPLTFLDFNVSDQAFSMSASYSRPTAHHQHTSQFRSMLLMIIPKVEVSLVLVQTLDQTSMMRSRKNPEEARSSIAFSARMCPPLTSSLSSFRARTTPLSHTLAKSRSQTSSPEWRISRVNPNLP